MKMLFVNSLYYPNMIGGAEKIVKAVAEAARDAGHESVIVSTNGDIANVVRHVDEIKVHEIGIRNLYWPYSGKRKSRISKALWHLIDASNPWMAREFARILEHERPDLINTHNLTGFSSSIWQASKIRAVPTVHTLHDYSLMCLKGTMYKGHCSCALQCRSCKALSYQNRKASDLVDGVVGVSEFTLRRHVDAGYFRRAVLKRVIHNALYGERPKMTACGRLHAGIRLGYVGRLVPQKGIEALIRISPELHQHGCTLTVAGRGDECYERHLRNLHGAEMVNFIGHIDPHTVYSSIDVLVVPSLWEEPFGMVIAEAYQYGIPVVASSRGGIPEIVEHGRTGLIFDDAQPEGLRDAILSLLRDPALVRSMRTNVLKKAHAFHGDRLRSEYLDAFNAAIDMAR